MPAFTYRIPVRFHDLDPAGIVFFARIFQYAHDAYEAWMRSIGFPLEPPPLLRGYALPLAHAEADFHAPIRLGQEVDVELTPASVGTSSFTLTSRLLSPSGTPVATVKTVHVCIDPASGRATPLPEPLRAALAAHLS